MVAASVLTTTDVVTIDVRRSANDRIDEYIDQSNIVSTWSRINVYSASLRRFARLAGSLSEIVDGKNLGLCFCVLAGPCFYFKGMDDRLLQPHGFGFGQGLYERQCACEWKWRGWRSAVPLVNRVREDITSVIC